MGSRYSGGFAQYWRQMRTDRYTLEQVYQAWYDGGLGHVGTSETRRPPGTTMTARLPKSVKKEKSEKGTSSRVTTLSTRHLPWRGLSLWLARLLRVEVDQESESEEVGEKRSSSGKPTRWPANRQW